MKRFVQNLRVFGTMSGRFLATAIVAVTVMILTAPAQADPGTGAVVTFLERDGPGYFWAVTPDGQLALEVTTQEPGNHVRLNPDGTYSIDVTGTQAPMTLSVPDGNGEWVVLWSGSGSFHSTDTVEPVGDDGYASTLEAFYMHVQGKLINQLDGSVWSLHVVAIIRNGEFQVLQIDLEPF